MQVILVGPNGKYNVVPVAVKPRSAVQENEYIVGTTAHNVLVVKHARRYEWTARKARVFTQAPVVSLAPPARFTRLFPARRLAVDRDIGLAIFSRAAIPSLVIADSTPYVVLHVQVFRSSTQIIAIEGERNAHNLRLLA